MVKFMSSLFNHAEDNCGPSFGLGIVGRLLFVGRLYIRAHMTGPSLGWVMGHIEMKWIRLFSCPKTGAI